MRKHGLRAIVLALMAALGLMAFSASVAQAEELHAHHTAVLRNNGTFLAKGTKLSVTGTQEGAGHFLVPGKNLDIECATGTVSEASVENIEDNAEEIGPGSEKSSSGLKTDGMGRVTFGSCTVKLGGVKSEPCTKAFNEHNKDQSGQAGKPTMTGLFLTALHLEKSILVNTHSYIIKLRQLSGESNFITLEFGGTCSLPAKVPVKGSVAGEFVFGSEDASEQLARFESDKLFGKEINELPLIEAKLLFGESQAFIDSNVRLKLVSGEKWGTM